MDAFTKLKYIQARKQLDEMNQKKLLREYPDTGLFSLFSDALTPVFKAVKLSVMDTSNVMQRLFMSIIHIGNPKKLAEDKKKYDEKRKVINDMWKPIVEDSIKTIRDADPFLMVGLLPEVFLVAKGSEVAVEVAKNAVEMLTAKPWETVVDDLENWMGIDQDSEGSGSRRRSRGSEAGADSTGTGGADSTGTAAAAKKLKKIRSSLSQLFYGDSGNVEEGILREQDEKKNVKDDPEGFLKDVFQKSGLTEEFNYTVDQILTAKTDLMKEALEHIGDAMSAIPFFKMKSLDDFKKTITGSGNKSELQKYAGDFQKITNAIMDGAKKVSTNKEFIEMVSKNLKKPAEKLTKEEIFSNAVDAVFDDMKKKFQLDKQVQEAKKKIEDYVKLLETIDEDVAVSQKALDAIKSREDIPSTKTFLEIYEQYQKEYKEFKNLVS